MVALKSDVISMHNVFGDKAVKMRSDKNRKRLIKASWENATKKKVVKKSV